MGWHAATFVPAKAPQPTMSSDPFAPPAERASSTLRVLCYIVLFTTALPLFFNVLEVLNPPDPRLVMEAFDSTMERFSQGMDERTGEMMEQVRAVQERLAENGRLVAGIKALGCALAMFGAWSMLRLDRKGFHFYVVGGLLWCFAPMMAAGGNVFTWVMAFLYGFVCLVFTVLFASRLKELR